MAGQISVVIIDADAKSRQYLKILLQEIQQVNIAGEAIDAVRGYELVKELKPCLVILDLFPGEVDHWLKFAEKITQNFPKTMLFVASSQSKPEVIINAMRAGSRAFLSKPLDKDDLLNAVRNAIRWHGDKAEGESGGKLVAVFGAKGGVGTTTIATNLAVNLVTHTKKSVVLVDLNLQFGQTSLFLNVQPKYSIVDVANNIKELDPHLFKGALSQHASGVCLLAGPPRVEEAESIRGEHLHEILILLRSIFDFIIIDTNKVLDDLTVKALGQSDAIITVFTVDLPSIYNTRRCLDIFQRMGFGQDKVLLVMNRDSLNWDITSEELVKSIAYPMYWRIPNQDYATVAGAINQGIPISQSAPRSKIGVSFSNLAEKLNGGAATEDGKTARSQKGSLIKIFFNKIAERLR